MLLNFHSLYHTASHRGVKRHTIPIITKGHRYQRILSEWIGLQDRWLPRQRRGRRPVERVLR